MAAKKVGELIKEDRRALGFGYRQGGARGKGSDPGAAESHRKGHRRYPEITARSAKGQFRRNGQEGRVRRQDRNSQEERIGVQDRNSQENRLHGEKNRLRKQQKDRQSRRADGGGKNAAERLPQGGRRAAEGGAQDPERGAGGRSALKSDLRRDGYAGQSWKEIRETKRERMFPLPFFSVLRFSTPVPACRWRTAPAAWTDPHRNRPRRHRYRWRCR